jgi:glycosyltransferase involved in cell wall biosynthesis
VKLGLVVQRYGADVNGGAEQHARYIAERLARHHEVEVWTTCARDYVTWANERPAGVEQVNGVTVRRFPVDHPRDPVDFGRRSAVVFETPHSVADELAWLRSEGPASRALLSHAARAAECDYVAFFSYRYYHAWHGARAVPGKALLVPTAERDPAIGVSLFQPLFRGVRALMYNSFEERAMIEAVSGNAEVPGVVVGVGSEVPDHVDPARFRRQFGIDTPFVVYVGRVDENKGCKELFSHFQAFVRSSATRLALVVIGNAVMPVPAHPRIRHLGFLEDRDKFDAMAAAEALVMPSYFESLSMVALEAWALGRPVLANGRCDVLRGQCVRSNAGLYYENAGEFVEALRALETSRSLRHALGRNGRHYFARHYAWPVVEGKYLDVLDRLREDDRAGRAPRAQEPLPGWIARRRRDRPPAAEVLATLPSGPVVPTMPASSTPPAVRPHGPAVSAPPGPAARRRRD